MVVAASREVRAREGSYKINLGEKYYIEAFCYLISFKFGFFVRGFFSGDLVYLCRASLVMKESILVSLGLAIVLTGCHSNIRDSSPSFLKDGIQLQQSKFAIDAEHAKIIMSATGFTYPVQFSLRRSSDTDQRPEILGTVVDSGRGKVFGWIAKLGTVRNFVFGHNMRKKVHVCRLRMV